MSHAPSTLRSRAALGAALFAVVALIAHGSGAVEAGAVRRPTDAGEPQRAPADRLLRNGVVFDGSEDPGTRADVLVRGDRIAAIGPPGTVDAADGAEVVDLEGLVLAPGFIDIHNHSTSAILERPAAGDLVSQGLTTIVVGADGGSPWPIGDYLAAVASAGPAVNVAVMVGHGTVRRRVMGDDFRRPATEAEIAEMARLVAEGMEQGALGLSTGLEYDPGYYATTEELIAVARAAAAHGGFYMTHMRDEELYVMEAVEEAIRIGREARLPVQISHIKMGDATAWGRSEEVLDELRAARREGIDVSADWYPYGAGSTSLSLVVPDRDHHDPDKVAAGLEVRGGAHRIQISRYEPDPSVEGMRLDEIAEREGVTPVQMYMRMIDAGGAGMISHSMQPEDMDRFAVDPLVMIASDGGIGSTHPRGTGTFPRVLGRYVRERGLLTTQQAIHKMSAMPARRLGFADRGRIRVGAIADLVAFDPQTVRDRSTFEQPHLRSQGIEKVWVAGALVWNGTATTDAGPGEPLRR